MVEMERLLFGGKVFKIIKIITKINLFNYYLCSQIGINT
jgi:hypothetical protein